MPVISSRQPVLSFVTVLLWLTGSGAVPLLFAQTAGLPAVEQRNWLEPVARLFGPELRRLQAEEATLSQKLAGLPLLPSEQQSERTGFHSRFANTVNATKWVQVDLGTEQDFDAVVLVPVDVAYGSHAGPGFGFPRRFRLETSDNPSFDHPHLLAAYDEEDFPSPGNYPVYTRCPGSRARYIRLTANRLWLRGDRALLALGELMVLRRDIDLAAWALVTASDSYDNSPTWQSSNATDGQSVLGPPVGTGTSPGNGWHADIATRPDTVKWVQVDLGHPLPLDEVQLFPAQPKDFPLRRGFGFPRRFKVEAATDSAFASPTVMLDCTKSVFTNPAGNPVLIPGGGVTARYIRITATELWERSHDYIFALSELQVLVQGTNAALNATVTSLDSIEQGSWSRKYLVDGCNSQSPLLRLSPWLSGLSERRELENSIALLKVQQKAALEHALRIAGWSGAGAGISALLLVLFWLQRLRLNRQHELENLRLRLAADLHDEIGSNLGSISLLSQMALRQPGADSPNDLAEINRIARQTAETMRDIVFLIKPGEESLADFLAHLREAAGRLLADIDWQMEAGELPDSLPLELKRHVFLFLKETLHNIRKHARARKARIFVGLRDRHFEMVVTDDGMGFDMGQAAEGMGLASMHRRAAALGGHLEVQSERGKGTSIRLRVPWPCRIKTTTLNT